MPFLGKSKKKITGKTSVEQGNASRQNGRKRAKIGFPSQKIAKKSPVQCALIQPAENYVCLVNDFLAVFEHYPQRKEACAPNVAIGLWLYNQLAFAQLNDRP